MSAQRDSTEPCWTVINDATGMPWDEEFNRHFTLKAEAEAERDSLLADFDEDYPGEERPTLTVGQDDNEPCVRIACDGCGYVLDQDGDGVFHVSPGAVDETVDDFSWLTDGDRHYCEDCKNKRDPEATP